MTVMNKKILAEHPLPYITDMEMHALLGGTADSRHSKIKRLIAQKKLLHIRRGLYCLTEAMGQQTKPHPFELAQYIYAPSYISLESALSFHQLIPEAVYTVTSVTIKRSKDFNTPLGTFSYSHLPEKDFYTEVERINDNSQYFFMAKPWKAICDYVYCYKKNWCGLIPLFNSLRIDPESLPYLSENEAEHLIEYYNQIRILKFINSIIKDQL